MRKVGGSERWNRCSVNDGCAAEIPMFLAKRAASTRFQRCSARRSNHLLVVRVVFPLLASSGQIATRVRINAMFFALLACTALYKVVFYATLFDVYFLLPRGFEITADLWDAAPVFSFQALVSVVDAPFLLHGSVDHTML